MNNQEPLDAYWTTSCGDFAIKKTRFGLYTSYDRELVELVTGGTYQAVKNATVAHLNWKRNGYVPPEGKEATEYSAFVGGKL